jgi:hypothetical protein
MSGCHSDLQVLQVQETLPDVLSHRLGVFQAAGTAPHAIGGPMIAEQELEKGISILKVIWTALAVSLIMYVVVIPLFLRDSTIAFPAEAYPELRMLMYGLGFATLVFSWFIRRMLLAVKNKPKQTQSRQHPALQRYTTAMIVALAMTEAIGIYGLILYLLGKNQIDLYLLTALAAAAMTLYFPRKEEVSNLAARFDRNG